jgi:hypothetical protein
MNKTELEQHLNNSEQFKEIWLQGPSKQSICALINGNVGWLMYLRFEGDAGYSSRNPLETSEENIEYILSNGQRDEYPKKWAYPIDTLKAALFSFIDNGALPKQVEWHDDSQ